MTALIKVEDRNIGPEALQTVDARELHSFLEVKSDFRHWIKNRISDFGFVEETDFTTVGKNLPGLPVQYFLTLGMAKELAMVERNDKGKEARLYFLECERRVKAIDPMAVLNDPAAMRGLLLTYSEKVLQLEASNAEMQPKADFFDAVTGSATAVDMAVVAKTLNMGIGRNQLFEFLRDKGILDRKNTPYQTFVDRGYFRIVESSYMKPDGSNHVSFKTVVFQKGMDYIRRQYLESGIIHNI